MQILLWVGTSPRKVSQVEHNHEPFNAYSKHRRQRVAVIVLILVIDINFLYALIGIDSDIKGTIRPDQSVPRVVLCKGRGNVINRYMYLVQYTVEYVL